jgi:hypothetical protein
MAESVYLLCAATSLVCAALLYRGYRRSRSGLLFWSSVCFAGLAVNNVLLFIDLVIVPSTDLTVVRAATALLAMIALLGGLVWGIK